MAVTYFQGFDIHQRLLTMPGLNAGGDDDASTQWTGTTFVRPFFQEGYLHGRALLQNSVYPVLGPSTQSNSSRFGAWVKGIPRNQGGLFSMMGLVSTGVSPSKNYSVQVINQNGDLLLVESTGGVNTAQAGPFFGGFTDTWTHYELRANTVNGQASLWRNGIQILSLEGSGVPNAGRQRPSVGSRPGVIGERPFNALYDHVYLTDHSGLTGSPIEGVRIETSQDRFESTNGLRGTLIIGGDRYITEWGGSLISSLNTFGGIYGKNVCNTVSYPFYRNPSNNALWTPESFDSIESWGVCFAPEERGGQGRVRLDALCLARLSYNNGMPLVHNILPGDTTYFNGPWERTNPLKSLAAHVNTIPRPLIEEREDAESLYISDEGCLLFTKLPDDGDDQPVPIGVVGLTFAEKNQVNHRDWTSVDGIGEAADAYFISGYGVYGESNKKFQSNYLTLNYEVVPTGQAYVQGIWDYSIDPDTGRWSMRQQVYGPKSSTEYKHASRKLKIRGHGKALQFKVSSFHDSPFVLNGWAVFVTSNTAV